MKQPHQVTTLTERRSFLLALAGDGRPLLTLVGLGLVLCGGFALFLAATSQLLPHDLQFLGLLASQVCGVRDGRLLHFMFHDRVAFGGAIIATGLMYIWLAEFPLRQRQAWAWWALVLSGAVGFGSFLAYLGYGYFDLWHGTATVLLLGPFALGLARSFPHLAGSRHVRALGQPAPTGGQWASAAGVGRACLLTMAAGMVVAGLTIMVVGMTRVFVPQDLEYMGLTIKELRVVSPHLIPLIAHDRAGFGGALASCGLAMFCCVWCGAPVRSLGQALGLAGAIGFATAIGVHPLIGYTDLSHLAPAVAGLLLFLVGWGLSYKVKYKVKAGCAPTTAGGAFESEAGASGFSASEYPEAALGPERDVRVSRGGVRAQAQL